MESTTTTTTSHPSSIMKRAIKYMQKTALDYSDPTYSGQLYLNAGEKDSHYRRQYQKNRHQQTQTLQHDHYNALDLETTLVNDFKHSDPNHHHQRSQKPNNSHPGISRKHSDRPAPLRLPSHISSAMKRTQYASDNILQSYEVYIPPPPPHDSTTPTPSPAKYWIIYLHGGYFRDPLVTSSSFHPALSLLTTPPSSTSSTTTTPGIPAISPLIAGYASINYRLSPHPGHPQDPTTTPKYELRNARFPEMLDDVLLALRHLQSKYNFGERYLLVGHSVGATLALLATLKARSFEGGAVLPPLAVAGVAGIYDFVKLHETYPEYEHMTRNAMEENQFEEASPAGAKGRREEFERLWAGFDKVKDEEGEGKGKKRWLILAHSKNDGLVPWSQMEAMAEIFEGRKEDEKEGRER